MKIIAILALCISAGIAAPNGYYAAPAAPAPALVRAAYGGYSSSEGLRSAPVPILKHLLQNDNAGAYNFEIQTGDGISQVESGSLKNIGSPEGPVNIKKGSYSYTGPDGILYTVNYTADEHGFHAEGAHLPTPPPVPEEIRKSLALPRVQESAVYKSAAVYDGYKY